jgi:Arc/MetJ family transcription regulator
VRDPGVEAYVEAIEGHLRARRGTLHILSPRDFGLARAWHRAEVPLAAVLVAIDLAFDAGERVTSLAYCQRRVEDLAACGPRQRPAPPAETVPVGEVASILASLAERLSSLRPGRHACFEAPLRKIEEVRQLIAVATRPNWDHLRRKLREIDDEVSAAVLESLGEEDRRRAEEQARRAIERHRGRVDDDALADATGRFIIHRARESLGLPRVSLL